MPEQTELDKVFSQDLRALGLIESDDQATARLLQEQQRIEDSVQENEPVVYEQPSEQVEPLLEHVYLGLYEDAFQKIYKDSILDSLDYSRQIIDVYKEQDLAKQGHLKKRSIFNENTVLVLNIFCKLEKPILDFIKSIYLKNKVVFINVRLLQSQKFLFNYLKSNREKWRVEELPETTDYRYKRELIEKTLDNWRLNTSSKEVRNNLIKVIIARIDDFETFKTSLDVVVENRAVITPEYLEELAGNVDFYKLDDLFVEMIRQTTPRKLMKFANYFLNVKEYPAQWILNMFREYLLVLADFYTLHYNGVIKHPIDTFVLENRLNYFSTVSNDKIKGFNRIKQQEMLDFVRDVPYSYISELTKVVFSSDYITGNKIEFYSLLKEMKYLTMVYGREKGFVNTRKLEEMKKNARFRKKKQ